MVFTISIEKCKIIEVWDVNHSKVLKYSQVIKNSELNDSKNIVAEDLGGLMNKVRSQINEWKISNDII